MKKYPFRLVTKSGQTGLIEVNRDGALERCLLPTQLLEGNLELTSEQIDAGAPYGLPFSEFVQLSPTKDLAQQLEIALHNAGVWTLEDLRTKVPSAISALQVIYGVEFRKIVRAAEAYIMKEIKPQSATEVKTVAPKVKIKKE
jgi:hypothetical protein